MDDICNNSGSHFDGFSVCTGKIKMNFSADDALSEKRDCVNLNNSYQFGIQL